MLRPCNKCRARGWYGRASKDGDQMVKTTCTRCQGTGQMNRESKAEKRQKKAARLIA